MTKGRRWVLVNLVKTTQCVVNFAFAYSSVGVCEKAQGCGELCSQSILDVA